jgi:hypothetical protein
MSNIDAQLLEYAKIMGSNEDLHPDLVPYVSDGPLGKQLRHPLVYQIAMTGNGWANAYYLQKVGDVAKALENKKYDSFVWLHERPYRVEAFIQIADKLPDTKYWSLLGSIWTDTENQWQNLEQWRELLSVNRSSRHYLMDESEVQLLNSLPELVTIYRGCVKGLNEDGLSWTLDKAKAEFFANRFSKGGIILEREIPKSDIIAVLTGRGESEVICEVKK